MTWDREFEDMMHDTITVEVRTATSGYGGGTYGTPTVIEHCRVVKEQKQVRSGTGDNVVSGSHVWIPGVRGITTGDRVTLPDGRQPPVIAVEQFPDETGPHHEVLYFA